MRFCNSFFNFWKDDRSFATIDLEVSEELKGF